MTTKPLTRRDIPGVITVACNVCDCTDDDFYGRRKPPAAVAARWIATRLLRKHTTLSYPDIADAMGRSNHSTTVTQYQRLDELLSLPSGTPARLVRLGGKSEDIGDLLAMAETVLGLGVLA